MIATKLILFASAIMAFALERGTAIELHYPIRHPLAHPDEATRVMSTKQKRIAMDGLRMRRKLENGYMDSYSHEVVEICKSGKSGSGKSDNGKSGSSTGKSGGGKSGSGKSYNGKSGSSTGKSGGGTNGSTISDNDTIYSSTGTGAGRRRQQELKAGCLDDDFTPSYEDDDFYSKPVPAPVGPPLTGREDDEPTPAPTKDTYDTRSNDSIDIDASPTATPLSLDDESGSNENLDRDYHPPGDGGIIPGGGLPPPPPPADPTEELPSDDEE